MELYRVPDTECFVPGKIAESDSVRLPLGRYQVRYEVRDSDGVVEQIPVDTVNVRQGGLLHDLTIHRVPNSPEQLWRVEGPLALPLGGFDPRGAEAWIGGKPVKLRAAPQNECNSIRGWAMWREDYACLKIAPAEVYVNQVDLPFAQETVPILLIGQDGVRTSTHVERISGAERYPACRLLGPPGWLWARVLWSTAIILVISLLFVSRVGKNTKKQQGGLPLLDALRNPKRYGAQGTILVGLGFNLTYIMGLRLCRFQTTIWDQLMWITLVDYLGVSLGVIVMFNVGFSALANP